MQTDRPRRETRPLGTGLRHSVLIIAVDAAHLADLKPALLAGRADAAATPVIILPVGDDAISPDALAERLDLSSEGMEVQKGTHGTHLRENCIHLLPQGRLFVVEDQHLCLRPRETAQDLRPLTNLVASLACQTQSDLRLILLTDEAEPGVEALLHEAGGTLVSTVDLRTDMDSGRPSTTRTLSPASTGASATTGRRSAHLAHDLRQPLQTLTLLQNLLARQVKEPKSRDLVERLGDTIQQLVEMLSQPAGLPEPLQPAAVPDEEKAAPKAEDTPRDTALAPEGHQPVYVIDDDRSIREAIRSVLEEDGLLVHDFDRCEAFLEAFDRESQGCLLVDAYLPGMSGLDLLAHLKAEGISLPSIVITGSSDVQMAVRAMKIGAADFIEKPVGAAALLAGVHQALELARDSEVENINREKAAQAIKGLTRRQRQIMAMVLDGQPSKNIAADLCISQRTVENHRAAIMKKTGSRSLPALARLVLSLNP